jgi:hypothetical protein
MRLSDIEDADRLASRDQLEVALGRLENKMDSRFNSVDAKINGLEGKIITVQRSIWVVVAGIGIQVATNATALETMKRNPLPPNPKLISRVE